MFTKRRLLFSIGIIIVLNSVVFGLPFVYESFLNIILGLGVIVITFLSSREKHVVHHKQTRRRERTSEIYAETHPRLEVRSSKSTSTTAPSRSPEEFYIEPIKEGTNIES